MAGKSYSGFVLNSHISLPQVEAGDLSEVLYPSHFPKSSGSLANTAAMRCASWRVSSSGRNRRRGFLLEIHVSKRLPIGVSYDETAIQFLDRPGGWEVALRHAPIIAGPPQWCIEGDGTAWVGRAIHRLNNLLKMKDKFL